MKKLLLGTLFCLGLSSCGGMMRGMSGSTQGTLIKQVSVETGCPTDSIKIIDMMRSAGNGSFALDVCGERKLYKQIGTVFMSSEDATKLINKISDNK